MVTRMVLYADKDKIITDGKIYGRNIYVAEGDNITKYHEITLEEYYSRLEEEDLEYANPT